MRRDKPTASADSSCGKGQCGWLPACPRGTWTLPWAGGEEEQFCGIPVLRLPWHPFSPSLSLAHSRNDECCHRVCAVVQRDCARHKTSTVGRGWMGRCGMVCADPSSLVQHICPQLEPGFFPRAAGERKKIFSIMISSAFLLPSAVSSAGPAQLLSSLSLTPLYPSSCLS